MIFNSIPFLLFALLFFGFWPLMRRSNNLKWIWITLMSFVFYGWWDWRFLFLLIGTGSIDYYCGRQIANGVGKKFFLWFSVVSNLASLVLFKYSLFLAESFDQLTSTFGYKTDLSLSIPEFTLVLPVGISFYTFNSLSYTIDLYRARSKPADSWLHFMAFISFFPHLVAGPIIRARDILGQLKKVRKVDYLQVYNGIKTCLWGLMQKMLIADNLAVFVNANFNNVDAVSDSGTWWICVLAFAFQIYFDFNGYSSIARGLAKICGIHFRLNFNHPYKAISFQDFWKRWHISLSTFFRDYVYIPLGGNRGTILKKELNRWTTMLLSGLWHGANLTFIAWGAMHAFFLSLESMLGKIIPNIKRNRVYGLFVFFCVMLSWVVFRADGFGDALTIYRHLFSFEFEVPFSELLLSNAFVWLVPAFVVEFGNIENLFRKNLILEAVILALMVAVMIFFRGPEQQFIYFQF